VINQGARTGLKLRRKNVSVLGTDEYHQYPNLVKITTMLESKNKMRYACNNEQKQLLIRCTKQRPREFNEIDYRTSSAARRYST